MDSSLVQYTSVALPYIPVSPGDNLETILQAINLALNTSSSAPGYSGYNLYCVTNTDGITHPATTQQFAEGISRILCDLVTDYGTFTGTTYPAAISTLTTVINALQSPALTYAPFSITSADTITVVYSKLFAGLTTMQDYTDVSGANWADIFVSPPDNVKGAINVFIDTFTSLTSQLTGYQIAIPNYDNSSNCLATVGGTDDDTVTQTIGYLTSYVCDISLYDGSAIDWNCLSGGDGTLQGDIQYLATVTAIGINAAVGRSGTGLLYTAGSNCSSATLEVDPSWDGLYKVKVVEADASPDFLHSKFASPDGSVSIRTSDDNTQIELSVASPVDYTTMVNASDPVPGYLQEKMGSTPNMDWGIGVSLIPSIDNTKLNIRVDVQGGTLINQILEYALSDEDILAKFCSLISTACVACLCGTIDDLIITTSINTNSYALSWTAVGGASTAQIAKYRPTNLGTWLTGNFTPANVLAANVTGTSISGLSLNTKYQFQVDTNCPGDVSHSNIYEAIVYSYQTTTNSQRSGAISISQNPLPTVDVIEYKLTNASSVDVDFQSTTGASPAVTFTAQIAGTYIAHWRYGTLINGVMAYSDAGEAGWGDSPEIVIVGS